MSRAGINALEERQYSTLRPAANTCAVLVFALIAAVPSASKPLSVDWKVSAALPEARSDYAAGVIDGKLVIAGGTWWEGTPSHWTRKIYSSATHSFDPRTQQWTKLPDEPMPLAYSAYTTVGNQLFVIGGYTGRAMNRNIYMLAKNGSRYAWSVVGEIPADRVFAQAVQVGASIYLVGGSTQFEPYDAIGTCCTTKTATNTLMTRNAAHQESGWRQLHSFPGTPRRLESVESDGKSIWMFDGVSQVSASEPLIRYPDVLRYDLARGVWSKMQPLPESLATVAPLSSLYGEGAILLFAQTGRVWQLDLTTLAYSETTPLPVPAIIDKFFWLDGRIIGAGGESPLDLPRRRSAWTIVGQPRAR